MVEYVVLDTDNLLEWNSKLFKFASSVDMELRCNASAVENGKLTLSYPSLIAINAFVDRGDLVAVAHEVGNIVGYIICSDDTNGKHGGCRCRWIGVCGPPQEDHAEIYAAMGDIACGVYGWLWGRVTNDEIRTLMINEIEECHNGELGEHIVTFKRP